MSKAVKLVTAFIAASSIGIGAHTAFEASSHPAKEQSTMFHVTFDSAGDEGVKKAQGCLKKIEADQVCSSDEVKNLVNMKNNEKNFVQGSGLMLMGSLILLGAGAGLRKEESSRKSNRPDVPPNPGLTM